LALGGLTSEPWQLARRERVVDEVLAAGEGGPGRRRELIEHADRLRDGKADGAGVSRDAAELFEAVERRKPMEAERPESEMARVTRWGTSRRLGCR